VGSKTGGIVPKAGGIVPTTGGNVVTASVTAGVGLEVSISMAGKDIEMDSISASWTGTNVTAADSTGAMVGTTSMTGPSPSSPGRSIGTDRSTMEMQDDMMMPSGTTGNCSRLPPPPSPDFRGCRPSTAPPAGALLWRTSVFRRRFGWEGTTDDDVDDADDARRTMAAGMESFVILCSGWQLIIMNIEVLVTCLCGEEVGKPHHQHSTGACLFFLGGTFALFLTKTSNDCSY
jgi:hypothetical protein